MQAERQARDARGGEGEPAVALLRQIAQGDRAAMDRFYRQFETCVYRFALSRLNDSDAASDVLNETMTKVWLEAARFRGESKVQTWVLAIAFQKSMDRLRGSYRHQGEELDAELPDHDAGDMALVLERMDDIRRVRTAVRRLSAIQRTALHLAFHEDMTYAEMAKVLGCPEGTAKTRVFHAKQALKGLLAAA